MGSWGLYVVPPLLIGLGGIGGIWVSQQFKDTDETYGLAFGLLAGSLVAGTYIKNKVSSMDNQQQQGNV